MYFDTQVLHRRGTDAFDEERVRQLSRSAEHQKSKFLQAVKMLPSFVGELGDASYLQPPQSVEIVTDHGEAFGCQIGAGEGQGSEIPQMH